MRNRLVLVHALSPLHAGTGQAVGVIDLPIARERPTGIPIVPGSSIKGALRAREEDPTWRTVIYGPETNAASDHSGAVQFSDVHTVLLPVRSLAGTFAWVTSPYLLSRFARDARDAGFELPAAPSVAKIEECLLLERDLVAAVADGDRVVLEDLDFAPKVEDPPGPLSVYAGLLGKILFPKADPADTEAWRDLSRRLCVVHDDAMSHLLESATEVSARIRLDETKKTVAQGALWYEEALPTETVLAGLAVASEVEREIEKKGERPGAEPGNEKKTEKEKKRFGVPALFEQVRKNAEAGLVQLGGKATVGRGSCRVLFGGAA